MIILCFATVQWQWPPARPPVRALTLSCSALISLLYSRSRTSTGRSHRIGVRRGRAEAGAGHKQVSESRIVPDGENERRAAHVVHAVGVHLRLLAHQKARHHVVLPEFRGVQEELLLFRELHAQHTTRAISHLNYWLLLCAGTRTRSLQCY